jgi:DNA-binding transcriptional ArsR family regulator
MEGTTMSDKERRARWAEVFASLASEPRLHIVELLAEDAVQCQEILAQIELSQPAVSYHLAKLERAGVLRKERLGTRNCYRLHNGLRTLIRSIMKEKE